ncbi:hypothetical protein LINPERHAP2_LOCUS181 [Linum perenne]
MREKRAKQNCGLCRFYGTRRVVTTYFSLVSPSTSLVSNCFSSLFSLCFQVTLQTKSQFKCLDRP